MRTLFLFAALLLSVQWAFSQVPVSKEIDSLYKEDQFYAGITYNLLGSKPQDLTQSGFSFGFHLGFIKDMPFNKRRNLAIGIGLGYSGNSFNQNLLVNKDGTGRFNYSILEDSNTYSKNKLVEHLVEMPIQFRWRTSTPTEYKFWRIYTGFKIGYVFANSTKYVGDLGTLKYTGVTDINKFQYGLTLSLGYNTWNLYAYYALNPLFDNKAMIDDHSNNMKAIKMGLMFYIL